jgi:hypothetical protein
MSVGGGEMTVSASVECSMMLSRGLRGEDRSAEQNKCCQQYNQIHRNRNEHNSIEYSRMNLTGSEQIELN